jgi:hypothetical protein
VIWDHVAWWHARDLGSRARFLQLNFGNPISFRTLSISTPHKQDSDTTVLGALCYVVPHAKAIQFIKPFRLPVHCEPER